MPDTATPTLAQPSDTTRFSAPRHVAHDVWVSTTPAATVLFTLPRTTAVLPFARYKVFWHDNEDDFEDQVGATETIEAKPCLVGTIWINGCSEASLPVADHLLDTCTREELVATSKLIVEVYDHILAYLQENS